MISNVVGIVLFLSVCGIAAPGSTRSVDCRKFVFAPVCRGVAKRQEIDFRGKPEPPLYIDHLSLKDLAQYMYPELVFAKAKGEEEENSIKPMNKLDRDEEEAETEYQKYNRYGPLYRPFVWS